MFYKGYVNLFRSKNDKISFFSQLLLGVFFSVRSVALIEDIPSGLGETQGYKSSAKFVFFKKK